MLTTASSISYCLEITHGLGLGACIAAAGRQAHEEDVGLGMAFGQ